ncbi:hypothetical protein CCAX7_009000 [Capsulimonas corticalis]|uniref:beta-galactosidase n=1 Tax=Capsulimonas corticalis TaxID=2219043 RepID=A0A402CU49_9BACT|nr:beta-galactosidase [Capsulimonas corticalis]BDI28849.1 hypothetical protein CCAX7_009000 [Capsulimonas corticalis]
MTQIDRSRLRWPDRIPVGVCHHAAFHTQSPPQTLPVYREFMRGEMERIAESGFNAFVLECGWNEVETGDDVWDFTRVDAVRNLCREYGLSIGLWIFAELTPVWVARSYPEALAVSASGYRSDSHSYAHPTGRRLVQRLIEKVLERYGDDPGLMGCNIGVESGFHWLQVPDSDRYCDTLFDYNSAAIDHYREWLRLRYETLDGVNLAHRSAYPEWESIEPPRARPMLECARMRSSHVPWLDWRQAQCDMMTDYLAFKAACVRKAAPQVPVSDQSYEIHPARGGQDLWSISAAMDVVGTSMFTSNAPGDYMRGNYLQDYHRSSAKDRPFWIWELRAGQNAWGVTNWGPPVRMTDIARFTWQVLGQGAKAIFYWNWRPHLGGVEVGGHGFTERDGAVTDRALRAGRIARALQDPAKNLLRFQMPPARIAILDSPASRIVAEGEGSDTLVLDAQRGLHALWKAQGFPVDFVSEDEVQNGALERYQLLGLPFQYLMGAECADAIRDWTKRGGTVFGGLWCAAKDALGYGQAIVPGHGLDELFGGREVRVEPVFSSADQPVTNFGAAWNVGITGRPRFRWADWPQGKPPASDLAGYRYAAALRPYEGARVLAVNSLEEPAALWNACGEGQAILFGSLPIVEDEFAASGLAALAAEAARAAGVKPPLTIMNRAGRQWEAKLLVGDRGDAVVIALNMQPEEAWMEIHIPGLSISRAMDFETDEPLSLHSAHDGVTLSIRVAGGDARAALCLPQSLQE